MLMALMTLFMTAMAVNAAEESAEMESGAAAVANVTEAVKETAENATAKAGEVKEEAAEKAGEVKEEAAAKAGEVKEEAAEKAAPGFESLFALTGLVGAALLLARRA